jgi:two-component system, cell cycle response regulator DivK
VPEVLLVEDNYSNACLVADVFEYDHVPATLVTSSTGEEAQRLAIAHHPVLILMDLKLPGIDGLKTTEMLKHNPLTKDIPVWAITACAMAGDREKALAAGCNEYFVKPLSMRNLGNRLRAFLHDAERRKVSQYASA